MSEQAAKFRKAAANIRADKIYADSAQARSEDERRARDFDRQADALESPSIMKAPVVCRGRKQFSTTGHAYDALSKMKKTGRGLMLGLEFCDECGGWHLGKRG
jgi:hypothetical protein